MPTCILIMMVLAFFSGVAQNSKFISSTTVLLDSCPPPQVIPAEATNRKIQISSLKKQSGPSFSGNFTSYGTEQGLALTSVSSGFKDKMGRLWFGTLGGGVSCYDGKSFTTITEAQGLPGNTIRAIQGDDYGNIWFGANLGLTVYDGKSFKLIHQPGLDNVSHISRSTDGGLWIISHSSVTHYTPGLPGKPEEGILSKLPLPDKYKNLSYYKILEETDGKIWFLTTGKGVLFYDGKSLPTDTAGYKLYTTSQGLPGNKLESVIKDGDGNLWFGTHDGVSRFDGQSFTNFTTLDGLADNVVLDIKTDKNGNLWFATNKGVSYLPKDKLSLQAPAFTSYTREEGLTHNIVFSITEDDNGNIWFGTLGGGLSRYSGPAFISRYVDKNTNVSNNNVRAITEDKQGNLWMGLFNGEISCYDGNTFTNFKLNETDKSTSIFCITVDKHGKIWLGTSDKGVFVYDSKSLPDIKSSFTRISKEQGLASNTIRCITEDRNGNMWFGTHGSGVSCYTPPGKTGAGFFTNYNRKQGLANHIVYSIYEDKQGFLWFCTNNGVSRFDGKSFTNYFFDQGATNGQVQSIVEDKNHNLWFGTTNGISYINSKTPTAGKTSLISFTTAQGLADNTVYDMMIAPFPHPITNYTINALVIGTNQGFSVLTGWKDKSGKFFLFDDSTINPADENFKNYSPVWEIYNNKTGYPVKDLNTNAMCVVKTGFLSYGEQFGQSKGTIWGGCGDDKIVQFNPFALNKNRKAPLVVIQAVKINEEKISWYDLFLAKIKGTTDDSLAAVNEEAITFGKSLNDTLRRAMIKRFSDITFSDITKWYPVPENLVLAHEHNNISFDFVAIETDKNFLVRYEYMLEGYDKDWRRATDKTSATFGNMHEGTYTFKVKACSPEGVWSEPITYTFTVLPPWYRTWWMYITYLIMLIVSVIIIVRWNGRRLRAQKKELEQKVKSATSQIREEKEKVELAHELISEQKKVVEEKNKDILDSIYYAKRIQDAMLKTEEKVSPHLPEHFVLFMPKDIVSGDFHWAVEKHDYWYVAAVDCTGHGVPGAFMSMLGMSFLNDIVNDGQHLSPAEILDQLRNKIITELRQTGESGGNKDGMDISIIRINLKINELQWAGANNPILLIENNQLTEIKPDKQPIGYYPGARPFTNHTLPFEPGATLYIFTDGYTDQFGGPNGKKFKIKQLKEILLTTHTFPMDQQKEFLKKAFTDWKGDLEQIDDVCVIGIRI